MPRYNFLKNHRVIQGNDCFIGIIKRKKKVNLKKNKAILLFTSSSLILYIHELYRLYLGCPRVLGDCYIDGADKFFAIKFIAAVSFYIGSLILVYRAIKKTLFFLKKV